MRLLAISYMLPPALFPQATQIGRLLAHSGAEIGAVCGAIGSAGLDHDFGGTSRLAFRLDVGFRPGLSGIALHIARRFLPLYARVPDEYRAWVPRAESAVHAKLRRSNFTPDLLVTFGDPMSDHLLGLRLKAALNLPWVAHFSDPWADCPFRRHDHLANVVNRRLERRVIANADHLIFTSQETVDLVMRKYETGWRQKCSVLPHSYELSLYPSPRQNTPVRVVRYVGNFYGHRTPLPLLRALHLILRDQPDAVSNVRFELVGRVPMWVKHHPAFRGLPRDLVRLVAPVPYSESIRLMLESDLLLVIDAPADVSVFLPSKLIDYIGAGVPIYGIAPPGASANLLSRLGGLVADPRNPEQIADRLAQCLRLVQERHSNSPPSMWGKPNVRAEFAAERVGARVPCRIGERRPCEWK